MSRSNYSQDLTGNIISTNNIGSIGIDTSIVYRILIISLIVILIIGFIPGIDYVYNSIILRLSLLSIVLLIMTTYLSNNANTKTNAISTVSQSFSIMDRCKFNLIEFISVYSASCPKLINSLYFPFQKQNTMYYKPLKDDAEDNYSAVNTFCTTLYQNVEDFLNNIDNIHIQKSQILTHFATLFVSPIVQKHWNTNYHSYYIATVLLINDLIDIANKYKLIFKNAQELDTFFMVYSYSKRYLYITLVNNPYLK
jgi:hypothetical protein